MSDYQLHVVFDREDRTYQFNEEVSGKVVVDTQAKMISRRIWIEYGWRTHGKGDQDKGGTGRLTLLSQEVQLQSEEYREYAFHFTAPRGPATYHSHILNIDWYVTAHLDTSTSRSLQTEQDFLLTPAEIPETIGAPGIWSQSGELSEIQGNPVFRPGQPPEAPFSKLIFAGLVICGLMVIVTALVLDFSASQRFYAGGLVLGCFALNGIYIFAYPATVNAQIKRCLEFKEVQVMPAVIYPGDHVACRLQIRIMKPIYVDTITAGLSALEVAVGGEGSAIVTSRGTAYEQSFTKTIAEVIAEEKMIYFDCHLPVLPGAPASFIAKNNKILWSVTIKIVLRRGSSLEKTFPITVLS
jgi:hypothetical protein